MNLEEIPDSPRKENTPLFKIYNQVGFPLVVSLTHRDRLSASSCCDARSDSRWSSSHPDPQRNYCKRTNEDTTTTIGELTVFEENCDRGTT